MKKLFALTLIALMGLPSFGMNFQDNPGMCEAPLLKGPSAPWIYAQNDLGWKFLQEQLKAQPGQNFFYSPASLSVAMQILLTGAGPQARKELTQFLGLDPDVKSASLTNDIARMVGKFQNLQEDVRIQLANGLWTNSENNFRFRPSFVNGLEPLAGFTHTDSLPFSESSVLDGINYWMARQSQVFNPVTKKLESLVPKVLDELDPNAVFVLINTLLVDAKWSSAFSNIIKQYPFQGWKGQKQQGSGFSDILFAPYYAGEGLQMVSVQLADPNFSVDFLMPDGGGDKIPGMLASLNSDRYNVLLSQAKPTAVEITLPDLDMKTSLDLRNSSVVRERLGLNAIFNAGNLEPMGSPQLYISQAQQDSRVRVTNTGYQGFSATTLVGSLESMTPQPKASFEANRPFVMVLRDKRDNQILQMAAVYSIGKETSASDKASFVWPDPSETGRTKSAEALDVVRPTQPEEESPLIPKGKRFAMAELNLRDALKQGRLTFLAARTAILHDGGLVHSLMPGELATLVQTMVDEVKTEEDIAPVMSRYLDRFRRRTQSELNAQVLLEIARLRALKGNFGQKQEIVALLIVTYSYTRELHLEQTVLDDIIERLLSREHRNQTVAQVIAQVLNEQASTLE